MTAVAVIIALFFAFVCYGSLFAVLDRGDNNRPDDLQPLAVVLVLCGTGLVALATMLAARP